jgi:NAD(P)-dependent dehydrogenase (short-subunit alcohol dehydrogenase family)
MRVAIVTGASQGIGARIAAGFRPYRLRGRRHLALDPRRHRQRHDQLEEQCSFFVKKCVPNPARATS